MCHVIGFRQSGDSPQRGQPFAVWRFDLRVLMFSTEVYVLNFSIDKAAKVRVVHSHYAQDCLQSFGLSRFTHLPGWEHVLPVFQLKLSIAVTVCLFSRC